MPSAFSFAELLTACDLCGADKPVMVDPAANIVRCRVCGYRFVNPRPTQAAIAESYSASDFYDGWLADEAGRGKMWTKRLSLFRGLGSNVRLLDIGAGIGTFLAMARDQLGWIVVGTEVSRTAVQLARNRFQLELLLGEAADLNLPSDSFELVTMWHVLEHVPSPGATLTMCHRLLSPNGRLAIAVPNDNDERWLLVSLKARLTGSQRIRYDALTPGREVHLSQFHSRVLTRALRSRGFSIERVTVDDHYSAPSRRSNALVGAYRIVNSVSSLNFAQATFILAKKER